MPRACTALGAILLLAAAACSAAGPNSAGDLAPGRPLAVALPPGGPGLTAAKPLADYLEHAINRPVQLRPEASYGAMAADLRAAQADVAIASNIGYLVVARAASVQVIGQAAMQPAKPAIVCSGDAGVKTLTDGGDWSTLRGKAVIFGPEGSLGGNVWPRYYMTRNGIDPIGDIPRAIVVPNEREAVLDVYNGIADCAAASSDIRGSLTQVAPDIGARVPVAFTAPAPVPPAPQLARKNLDRQLIQRFEQALAGAARDQAAAAVLTSLTGAAAARTATDQDYSLLRTAVTSVDPVLVQRTQ